MMPGDVICAHFFRPFVVHSYGYARLSASQTASQLTSPCIHALTSMFNKDTLKHETCVPCVGRASTRHGRLKSALRHAILVGCGRCFTLIDLELILCCMA